MNFIQDTETDEEKCIRMFKNNPEFLRPNRDLVAECNSKGYPEDGIGITVNPDELLALVGANSRKLLEGK